MDSLNFDLNNTKLHSVALAFSHNYSHFITDKFSQVKHQLRDSACRQSKIEDISTIINDCITNIEFFFTTLKQLHPKNSCPVFDQTLQKNSPEGKLVNICLDLYAYVSIHLFQDQYESTKTNLLSAEVVDEHQIGRIDSLIETYKVTLSDIDDQITKVDSYLPKE